MKKKVVITFEEDSAQADGMALMDLEAKGLDVLKAYDFGVVIGLLDESKMDAFSQLHYVKDIREEIRIPPPDKNAPAQ